MRMVSKMSIVVGMTLMVGTGMLTITDPALLSDIIPIRLAARSVRARGEAIAPQSMSWPGADSDFRSCRLSIPMLELSLKCRSWEAGGRRQLRILESRLVDMRISSMSMMREVVLHDRVEVGVELHDMDEIVLSVK